MDNKPAMMNVGNKQAATNVDNRPAATNSDNTTKVTKEHKNRVPEISHVVTSADPIC